MEQKIKYSERMAYTLENHECQKKGQENRAMPHIIVVTYKVFSPLGLLPRAKTNWSARKAR
jgi:hypothetical protein